MIYPEFLKSGDIIGTTAVSAGCECEMDCKRLDLATKNLKNRGFKIIETQNCRKNENGRSSSKEERAKEFNELIKNKEVKAIISLSGGEFLIEILPYIDFELLSENHKWVQGYSDPTGILYPITTNLDIATIYGDNFKSFSMNPMHFSLENNVELLQGNKLSQKSFEMYEDERKEYITGNEEYLLNKKVEWINLNDEEEIDMKGRIIGGCIDILLSLIGTKFDGTMKFIEKYKKDGIIWYFDNCEKSSEDMIRAMWQFKQLGYLKYTKGIVFGRTGIEKSYYNISFKEAIKQSLSDLNIPIILETDIGHKAPRMTIINGAIASIKSSKGKGCIEFELR